MQGVRAQGRGKNCLRKVGPKATEPVRTHAGALRELGAAEIDIVLGRVGEPMCFGATQRGSKSLERAGPEAAVETAVRGPGSPRGDGTTRRVNCWEVSIRFTSQ